MIALIQRVIDASVTIDDNIVSDINRGMLILLGVEKADSPEAVEKLAQRVAKYRIFADTSGKMNLSALDTAAEVLVVSQFTLVADTHKGLRPGFSKGATPQQGEALYLHFVQHMRELGLVVKTGQFGADMQVALTNDGPVTLSLTV